jgi:hypothetical protein
MLVRQRCGVHVHGRPVLPVGQPDPLQLRLVRAGKWIDDQSIAQQVGLHGGRDGCRVPLLGVGVRGGIWSGGRKAKLPAPDDHLRRQGAFALGWHRKEGAQK